MATFDFPNELLQLERSAWTALQAGTLTTDQAAAVQDRITAYATEAGASRVDVEMALKKTVRHTETASA